MSRLFLKELEQNTSSGHLVVSMPELDFLFMLTDKKDPRDAVEIFAVACMTHFKDPQEVLKALNIMPFGMGAAFFEEQAMPTAEPEPTYQRIEYEVVRKKK